MSWLHRLFRQPGARDGREALLNEGLELAMAFGQHWLEPIQSRLSAAHPELSPDVLDELNELCREAMRYAHSVTRERSLKFGDAVSVQAVAPVVRARFHWISDANMRRLFSQGMYYAWKDGAVKP